MNPWKGTGGPHPRRRNSEWLFELLMEDVRILEMIWSMHDEIRTLVAKADSHGLLRQGVSRDYAEWMVMNVYARVLQGLPV